MTYVLTSLWGALFSLFNKRSKPDTTVSQMRALFGAEDRRVWRYREADSRWRAQ